jgi:pyruvate,water dikinase
MAWAEVKCLTRWRQPWLRWLVGQVQRGFALREWGKSSMVASLWPIRRLLLELGGRLVASGHLERPEQVFHLSNVDLSCLLHGYWDGRGAGALVQDRTAQRQAWLRLRPPDVVVDGERLDAPGAARDSICAVDAQVWHGIGVSSGRSTAVARTVRHPDEGTRLGVGDILVAPSTDPGWTPLCSRASAVVMETAGYLSHGAIVAREYGLPAVVNIPNILSYVTDGETLTVDGDRATVGRQQ